MAERCQERIKKPEAQKENKAFQMKKIDPSQSISSPVDQILFLQRTIGNQAVQGLIKSGAIQAKLKISMPGDRYEQEADRIAEQVAASKPLQCTAPSEEKAQVQRKTISDSQGAFGIKQINRKRKQSSVPDPARIEADMVGIFTKLDVKDPDGPTRSEWQMLAKVIQNGTIQLNKSHTKTIEEYFSEEVGLNKLTFETITEDQRVVFRTIRPDLREELRKKALMQSKLYKAVTEMHVDKTTNAEAQDTMRKEINRNRFSAIGKQQLLDEDMKSRYSVAANFMYRDGEIFTEAFKNIPSNVKNVELADYIKKHDLNMIIGKLHIWACGIGNIYAIAMSRKMTGQTIPKESAINHAILWFRKMTLGTLNDSALVYVKKGQLNFQTGPILEELSEINEKPEYGDKQFAVKGQDDDQRIFSNSIENTRKRSKTAHTDARVGVAQGEGHMYTIYKDMDGIWRPMDIYMDLADHPEGGVPNAPGYATKKLWHKFIIDNPK